MGIFKGSSSGEIIIKCPNCGSNQCKYIINRTDVLRRKKQALRKNKSLRKKKRSQRFSGQSFKKNKTSRTDFRVKCKKCGWEGEIK